MVRGFSKAIVAGNITRDPELRTTPNGANTCTVSVAVNRSYKDGSGNNQESVSFLDCVFWNKAAEIVCQYAKKGTGILVSGRLDQRSWEDKDGQKRSRVEIVVEDFNFIGGNERDGGDYEAPAPAKSSKKKSAPVEDIVPDDIPMDDEEIDVGDIPF